VTIVLLKIFLTNLTKFWEAIVIALGTHRKVKRVSLHYLVKYLVFLDFRWPVARFFQPCCRYIFGDRVFVWCRQIWLRRIESSMVARHRCCHLRLVAWFWSAAARIPSQPSVLYMNARMSRSPKKWYRDSACTRCWWMWVIWNSFEEFFHHESGLSNHTTVCKVEDLGRAGMFACTCVHNNYHLSIYKTEW